MKIKSIAAVLMLAVFATSCSSVKEGVVFGKGQRWLDSFFGTKPVYWVDVRVKDDQGNETIKRVLVYEKQWRTLKAGDEFHRAGTAEKKPESSPTPSEEKPKPKKVDSASTKPQSTPAQSPLSNGLLGKIFKKKAEPAATPKPQKNKKPKPVAKATPAEKAKPEEKTVPPEKPKSAATPAPLTDAQKDARFHQVQAKALEDPGVRALKMKTHTATTDEEQQKAMQDYRKALFDKMRQLDGTIKDRIDKAEGAKPE
jgi:outer membrane biosynthesis protein TonB